MFQRRIPVDILRHLFYNANEVTADSPLPEAKGFCLSKRWQVHRPCPPHSRGDGIYLYWRSMFLCC